MIVSGMAAVAVMMRVSDFCRMQAIVAVVRMILVRCVRVLHPLPARPILMNNRGGYNRPLYMPGGNRVRHRPIAFMSGSMILFRRVFLAVCWVLLAACVHQPVPQTRTAASIQAVQAQSGKYPQKPAHLHSAGRKRERPTVMGWVEKITLSDSSHTIKAKLDSGAKTSSVDAEIIKTFTRDGKKIALYRVMLDDNVTETYESRLIRWVRIKDKKGGYIRRPVVRMHFCIGKKTLKGEVSLAERGHFIYPVLIGRNMLEKGNILVDTSRTFIIEPKCGR